MIRKVNVFSGRGCNFSGRGASNVCMKAIEDEERRQFDAVVRRERKFRAEGYVLDAVEAVADDGADRREMLAEMHGLIRRLSVRERAVVLLWLEEFSYDEIAEVIGVSRNVVATLLFRIKQKLHRFNNEDERK